MAQSLRNYLLVAILFGVGMTVGDFSGRCGADEPKSTASKDGANDDLKNWTDEKLRSTLEEAKLGGEPEKLLAEIVRRGGDNWSGFLNRRHDALLQRIERPGTTPEENAVRRHLCNLELLTALRRTQKKPDPLRIFVTGRLKQSYWLTDSPRFRVVIINLDEEKQPVHGFKFGGGNRSGRLERWRVEIRGEKAGLLPAFGVDGPGGGVFSMGKLEFGESWDTELRLSQYVDITAPETYKLRVHYHNDESIAGSADISQLITSQSAELELEIRPIRIYVTDQQRKDARQWIAKLPEAGPVKMAIGYVQNPKFLDPKSPAGELQNLYDDSVPDLIDAAIDPNLKPGQRAWVLGLLFAITRRNDPRGGLFDGGGILGSYEYEQEDASGYSRGGTIDPEKQKAFAEKWRAWKTDKYYTIEKL